MITIKNTTTPISFKSLNDVPSGSFVRINRYKDDTISSNIFLWTYCHKGYDTTKGLWQVCPGGILPWHTDPNMGSFDNYLVLEVFNNVTIDLGGSPT